jgi:hypothetical protein
MAPSSLKSCAAAPTKPPRTGLPRAGEQIAGRKEQLRPVHEKMRAQWTAMVEPSGGHEPAGPLFSRPIWPRKHHCISVNFSSKPLTQGHFPWLTRPRSDKSTEAVTAATFALRWIGQVLGTQSLSGHVAVATVGNTGAFGHRIPTAAFVCRLPILPNLVSTASEQ